MRQISLATWEDAPRRVNSVKRSLELIYGVKLDVDLEDISLDRLYPTEEFLENDKLALVFLKIVTEGYNVPIIAAKRDEDYFVLDGHHRSFIFKKLSDKTIKAYVLKFPKNTSYRNIAKRPLEELPIRDVSIINDIILKAWQRILGIMKHYEAIYHVPFNLKTEQIRLEDLVPTQPQVIKAQINSIREPLVPIACVQHQEKYYILDGHARSLRAKQLGLESIEAIVFLPPVKIDFGIVKTAKETNLKTLEDIRIS